MDTHADQQLPAPRPRAAVPYGQIRRAEITAAGHPDEATRDRARARLDAYRALAEAVTSGRVTHGSRTPVKGLPAWVTPEVLHGGFATEQPLAGGPLQPYEYDWARQAGLEPPTASAGSAAPGDVRRALFTWFTGLGGLARLDELLETGAYAVEVPEEGALLTVARLASAGDLTGARELLDEITPFADRLRFAPRPAAPAADPLAVHRSTAGEAARTLERRAPNPRIETQREAVTVWLPFTDRVLAHWLLLGAGENSGADEHTGARPGRGDRDGAHPPYPQPNLQPYLSGVPDEEWREQARALLGEYAELAAAHTRCTRRLRPKENLGIMLTALRQLITDSLGPRQSGLLKCALQAMVRKRGIPGSTTHRRLREGQSVQTRTPSFHTFAKLVRDRLTAAEKDRGLVSPEVYLADVTPGEGTRHGLPPGTPVPAAITRPVLQARSAPVEELVRAGLVPSAEVLAELIPQLVAVTAGDAYVEPSTARLAAAHRRAFSARRSLLLLDLAHQVRAEELPWVRLLEAHRIPEAGREPAAKVLRQLGELALRTFPGTILPNPFVRELGVLARQSEDPLPFVEELAADIFEGTFTPKFLTAARIAADLLEGTLYQRYYRIDTVAVRSAAVRQAAAGRRRDAPAFAGMCVARAPVGRGWSVAGNGTVIEQSQILTTHNLAVLVSRAGIEPAGGWEELAHRSFHVVCERVRRIHRNPRPLPAVKDAAYAWRQMIFQLSLCDPAVHPAFLDQAERELGSRPEHVRLRLTPALHGLRRAAGGLDPEGDGGRLFLGWAVRRHWMCAEPQEDSATG